MADPRSRRPAGEQQAGDQPADHAAEPSATPDNAGQTDAEHAPVAATPTEAELADALDATPEAKAALEANAQAEADAADAPELVRLLPADWTVHSVEFPYGEPEEGATEPPRLTIDALTGYDVAEAEADDIIAAAGSHGFALRKESVA